MHASSWLREARNATLTSGPLRRLGGRLQGELVPHRRSQRSRPAARDWAVGLPADSGAATARRRQPLSLQASSCCSPQRGLTEAATDSSRLRIRPAARPRRHAVCAAAAAAAAGAVAGASPATASAAVLVGWLVIAGSCIRSLPQILRILKNNRWVLVVSLHASFPNPPV